MGLAKKLLNFFNILYARAVIGVRIDFASFLSLRVMKNRYVDMSKSREYPIMITASSIGDCKIGEGCKIVHSQISNKVELGRFVSVNGPATRISSRINGIKIGSFTSIASNVVIQEDYHNYQHISSYFFSQNIFKEDLINDIISKGPITIGEDVWIGSNSVVLSGVSIGRGSIIGAGSVVTKDIPKYSIVAGNPARVIKSRFDEKTIDYLESLQWWEWDLEKIIKNKELFKMEIVTNTISDYDII